MGAHFAPPFAILVMHKVESVALKIIQKVLKYNLRSTNTSLILS